MGGPVPLGYRLEDRKLFIEPEEAKTVTRIFETYLDCGNIGATVDRLQELGIKIKQRKYRTGQTVGGVQFSCGGLQKLLRSPIYRGQIAHKEKIWPGEHDGIIDEALWQKVQDRIDGNDKGGSHGLRAKSPSLLNGLLSDEHGRKFVPNHATNSSRRYRYYVTGTEEKVEIDKPKMRLPAHDLEEAVVERLRSFLTSAAELGQYFDAEHLSFCVSQGRSLSGRSDIVDVRLNKAAIGQLADGIVVDADKVEIRLKRDTELGEASTDICLDVDAVLIRSGGETKLVIGDRGGAAFVDEKLSLLLAEAFDVRKQIVGGRTIEDIAAERDQTPQWVGKLLRLGWLPPELVEQVLEDRKAAAVTRRKLSQAAFRSAVWEEQMKEVAKW